MIGGEGGIRTHGDLAVTMAFETTTIDHSVTSPFNLFTFKLRHVFQTNTLAVKLYSRCATFLAGNTSY